MAKRWKLANIRSARIFHDSQPGAHKADRSALVEMEMVNRHYIMTHIAKSGVADYLKLAVWHVFQLAVCAAQNRFGRPFWQMLRGNFLGIRAIMAGEGRA